MPKRKGNYYQKECKKNKRNKKNNYNKKNDDNKNNDDNKEITPLYRFIFVEPPPPQELPPPPELPPLQQNTGIKVRISNDNDYFKTEDKLYEIDMEVKSIDDLIKLAKTYDPESEKKYVINLKVLNRCLGTLIELNNMIGMKSIKDNIINLFFFYLQDFYNDKGQMLHTIIEGSPGSGKTEVAKILAKLYYNLGIVKTNKFIIAKRSDLIGKYLGHTAANTQKIFDDAENGVIFIDEAYSLGNEKGTDSFSKECIDTINQNLTEKKKNVIVIIAGYKRELETSFFRYNPGLLRRFPFRYTILPYSANDLMKIYFKMMNDDKWSIKDNSITLKFFEKNIKFFKYSGGDMETLWNFTKITHSRRVFGKIISERKKIIINDLKSAFLLFATNEEVKNRNNEDKDNNSNYSMYL